MVVETEDGDALMRATSIEHRLNKHLESAGLYAGKSHHNFGRGQIQSLVAAGTSNHIVVRLCKSKLPVFWTNMLMSAGTFLVCSAWATKCQPMTSLLEQ